MNHLEKLKRTSSQTPIFKRSLLAMCIIAATSQGQAFAAEEVAAEEPAEVVVTGIRESLKSAQETKREASTVKDVVTASDISALPDKSVVEALSRVPGVAIERFRGASDPDHFGAEGSSATVRGLNRVRSEFNGRDSFSATGGGGLNFGDVPPELMGSVEVVKNQTADLTEGGIAGTVNLNTRKPFDSPDMQLAGTLKTSYGTLSEKVSPEFSGLFSNRWDTGAGEFGALFNVSASQFEQRSSGIGVHNFYERSPRGVGAPATSPIGTPIPGAGTRTLYMPPSVSFRNQDDDRERRGFATSFQWESPDETLLATLEYIRSDSKLAWSERAVENKNSLGDQLTDNRSAATLLTSDKIKDISGPDASFDESGRFTHGYLTGVGYLALTRARDEESVVNDLSFNLRYKPTDQLTITGDIQGIKADNEVLDFVVHNQMNVDIYTDLRGDRPTIDAIGRATLDANGNVVRSNAPLITPASVVFRSAMDHATESEGESSALKLDAEYTFEDMAWIKGVKTGLRYSEKEQTHKESTYNWGLISPEWAGNINRGNHPELSEYYDFGSDYHDGALTGQTGFWFPRLDLAKDPAGLYNIITGDLDPATPGKQDYITSYGGNASGNPWEPLANRTDADMVAGTNFRASEVFALNQKRTAIYGRLDFGNEDLAVKIKGNVGARYVKIDLEATGYTSFPRLNGEEFDKTLWAPNTFLNGSAEKEAELFAFMNGAALPTAHKPDTYTTVLPSLNLNFGFTDDFLVRLAVSKGIYLPTLDDTQANFSVNALTSAKITEDADGQIILVEDPNVDGFTASGVGNPYLKPEESLNLDVTAEWYFADVGSITLSLFNKDLENLIRTSSATVVVTNPTNGISQTVNYSGPQNVGKATIRGFEIAYQQTFDMLPEPFNGLGTQINYTYVDANEKAGRQANPAVYGDFSGLPLEGLSENTANFTVFYETDKISTRFAYNMRSEYLLTTRDEITKSPIYVPDNGFLDYSFRYTLSENYKIGFEVTNVLNEQSETKIQYNQEGGQSPRNFFINDRKIALTLSGSY